MELTKPALLPANPRFSSGPTTKPKDWALSLLNTDTLGRSHRASIGKARLLKAIEDTRDILNIPPDYRIGIVPASDTGAVEMALWSLLGARGVDVLSWESFGADWAKDIQDELGLEATHHHAEYGALPDLSRVNFDHDVVFTWNGTTSGVCLPNGDMIPGTREGLTICDATSAAFAMSLPWDKLDVTTFSWQKVLGGEAAHGMLILSPRAVERLESYTPPRPLPKVFRLAKNGKLIEGIFKGETINTPSMLCVEDYLAALDWARAQGGLSGLIARANANAGAVLRYVEAQPWIESLTINPATQSTTSVCLCFTDERISDPQALSKAIVARLASEGAAYDIGAHRNAKPGLRIWCGATVEASDIEALMPWIGWAYHMELAALGLG